MGGGWAIEGTTTALHDGRSWVASDRIRLEQSYRRIAGQGRQRRYDYAAPAFSFTSQLVYDSSGLVLDYPGIARRAG